MANSALITVDVASGAVLGDGISLVGKLGTAVLTSLAPVTDNQAVVPMVDVTAFQKRIVGCLFGAATPRFDVPKLLELYRQGDLLLDQLVTRT